MFFKIIEKLRRGKGTINQKAIQRVLKITNNLLIGFLSNK